ncbi:MAG: hypothetical protein RJB13_1673 [Pseudomonadota bacterium]
MSKQHLCPYVARESWKGGTTSSHPSVHLLSQNQNPCVSASNKTVGWLLGLTGVHAGEDFRITLGETFVGSGWDSGIVLTTPEVSRRHAHLLADSSFVQLSDNQSATGVFVNSVRVTEPVTLSHADQIRFGVGDFLFFDASVPSSGAVIDEVLFETYFKKPRCTLGWLITNTGDCAELDFRLIQGVNRLGSLPNLEISIPDPNLSSIHLTFECSPDRIYLRPDSDSFHVLRGHEITQRPTSLKNGDVIKIGGLELTLRCIK